MSASSFMYPNLHHELHLRASLIGDWTVNIFLFTFEEAFEIFHFSTFRFFPSEAFNDDVVLSDWAGASQNLFQCLKVEKLGSIRPSNLIAARLCAAQKQELHEWKTDSGLIWSACQEMRLFSSESRRSSDVDVNFTLKPIINAMHDVSGHY